MVILEDKYNPYRRLTDHHAWHVVSSAINKLIQNKDIVETTAHEFIVGTIVSELWRESLIDRQLKPKDEIQIDGHWDVIDKHGKKIKEVAPGGKILWQWDKSKDAPVKKSHEYDQKDYSHLTHHHSWKTINDAVESLVENGDVEEKIPRKLIIGYLVQELIEQSCFSVDSVRSIMN